MKSSVSTLSVPVYSVLGCGELDLSQQMLDKRLTAVHSGLVISVGLKIKAF